MTKTDVVGMEACSYAFLLAHYLQKEVGCVVYVFNSGKLRMIWQSTKKTDKEDALKIAKFIQRHPEGELPLVSLSTEREEELRQLISMKQFLVKTRTVLINRFHSLHAAAGKTGLRKNDLMTAGSRKRMKGLTPALKCSGDTERYGHIRRGGCRALRSIAIQSAWVVSRSSNGGRLKAKFATLSGRMSKTKSAADGGIDVGAGETPPSVRRCPRR